MAARLSALRSAGRQQVSASTMGVRQVTGSHVLRIDGFTQLSKTVANNTEMRSATFNVGGHDWCLACYPNGCSDLYKGYVSIFLQQASHEKTGAATAKGQLSILDRDGMPSCTKHITERTFKGPPFGWGEIDFVKHEDLDKDKHLHDGCLTVLCDVTKRNSSIRWLAGWRKIRPVYRFSWIDGRCLCAKLRRANRR
jgi:speckle-type POZ protein